MMHRMVSGGERKRLYLSSPPHMPRLRLRYEIGEREVDKGVFGSMDAAVLT